MFHVASLLPLCLSFVTEKTPNFKEAFASLIKKEKSNSISFCLREYTESHHKLVLAIVLVKYWHIYLVGNQLTLNSCLFSVFMGKADCKQLCNKQITFQPCQVLFSSHSACPTFPLLRFSICLLHNPCKDRKGSDISLYLAKIHSYNDSSYVYIFKNISL